MYDRYGYEKAIKFMQGNREADLLADEGLKKTPIDIDVLDIYSNNFVLQSNKRVAKKTRHTHTINSNTRPTLRDMIREEHDKTLLHTKKKEKYAILFDEHAHKSKFSDSLIKTKNYKLEKQKKMMIQMVHETLPTMAKLYKHIAEEEKTDRNWSDNPTYFYRDRYSYCKSDVCPLCGNAPETIDHLFTECKHAKITAIRNNITDETHNTLERYLQKEYDHEKMIIWYACDKVNETTDKEKNDFDYKLGTKGIIPTTVEQWLLDIGITKQQLRDITTEFQTTIMQANQDIWSIRNATFFAHNANTKNVNNNASSSNNTIHQAKRKRTQYNHTTYNT